MTRAPRVRVVVLDYNGGELTLNCLRCLLATDWPPERLDVVLVDNGSSAPVTDHVRAELPGVRLLRSDTNRGYAGGMNLGLGQLQDTDYVALVNNDVTVPPGWLAPLARALEGDESIGASSPKILLDARYLEVTIDSQTSRRGGGDPRELGTRVSGLRIAGREVWRQARPHRGFWGPEVGDLEESEYEWTSGRATLLVPVAARQPEECELLLAADRPTKVQITCGDQKVEHVVGTAPAWYAVPLEGVPYDVINNVGSALTDDGYGADRGYLERDDGQYQDDEDVFAWCGAIVLLRSEYLVDAGLFDERLFLYYEDLELSWRGRKRGWRYRYVPDSVVRHVHTASSVEASDRFVYFNERNRLLTLTRHASGCDVARALARYLLVTASYARRDVVSPLLQHRPVQSTVPVRRLRALAGYAAAAPSMLRSRLDATERIRDREP
jgi:GT2 family glycosyltransferase